MPPHKQPPSLLKLSTSAVVKLVMTSLVNMKLEDLEKRRRPFSLCMTSPPLQEALETVQQVLVDGVLPAMWDSLYHAVQEHARQYFKPKDNRRRGCVIIFQPEKFYYSSIDAIFYHENLRILTATESIADYMMSSKLRNVVELDIPRRQSYDLRVFALIGQECRKLQIARLGYVTVPECYASLAGCTGLKYLSYGYIYSSECIAAKQALDLFPCLEHYNYNNMGEVLLNLNTTKTLKLRYIKEQNCTVEIMNRIIALCPHLQVLHVISHPYDLDFSSALAALTTSSLQIRELEIKLTHFDEVFRHFIEIKGKHLSKFTLECPPIPEQAAQLIANYCPNLSHLKVHYRFSTPNPSNALTFPEKRSQSSLTNLKELEVSFSPGMGHVELLKIFLPLFSQLSSLTVYLMEVDINEFLVKLMKSVEMNSLEYLKVIAGQSAVLSDTVLKDVYVNVQGLKSLTLHCNSDVRVKRCLWEIQKEIRQNNLDFTVHILKLEQG